MVVASPMVTGRSRVIARTQVLVPTFMRGRIALITGTVLLVISAIGCIGAPLFTQYSPTAIDPLNPLLAPFSPGHLLGTDEFGRDLLSRILYGGRYDLAIAFGATSVTMVFGMLVGLFAGHFGRPFGTIAMRFVDLVFAFPFIVLVIAIIAMLGPSLFNLFIALWVASWVSYARIAHGRTVSANGYGYVVAARALGFSRLRIIFRHTLPSVLPACLIFAMVDAVGNVLLGASLGFLGIGIRQPTPEWGSIIAEGQNYILSEWWLSILPGIALVVLGVALSLIGDGLADALRPRDAR
ncbi:MAG TPA: ABC transporter permease [Pseudonocardiaceae bacterium]|nr:ABC transporter permease [Pseudonocardiaceae bacterium]